MKLLELLLEANNVESLDKPDTVAELQETVATLQQENQEMQ